MVSHNNVEKQSRLEGLNGLLPVSVSIIYLHVIFPHVIPASLGIQKLDNPYLEDCQWGRR